VVPPNHSFARLETRIHLRDRPDSDDSAGRDGNRVVRENRVERRDREHPAGFYQEICGFRGHLRKSAGFGEPQYIGTRARLPRVLILGFTKP
jgi:hypothetical protein